MSGNGRCHRVLIVDDETLARQRLRQLLHDAPDFDVTGECSDGRQVAAMVRETRPDVVFLDVRMPHVDGFEAQDAIRSLVKHVVFVTAHSEFAARAFDVAASDYLVKPVTQARFRAALDRIRRSIDGPGAERILLGSRHGGSAVDVDDVSWVEADGAYVVVHAGGRRHVLRESMAQILERLGPSQFVRIHRSAGINVSHVRAVRRGKTRVWRSSSATECACRSADGKRVMSSSSSGGSRLTAVRNKRRPLIAEVVERQGTTGTSWPRHFKGQMLNTSSTSIVAAPTISATSVAYWTLRVGAALCFIGHGAFGFITKAAWLPYFAVAGIPESWAWQLMPIVGAVDVVAGMAVLFAPRGLPLVYMTVWALWTALLRPLAGESVFETLERAGNYGVPFALLLLAGFPRSIRDLLEPMMSPLSDDAVLEKVAAVLKWSTVLLLFGHGALGAITGKVMLDQHYASIGLQAGTTALIGWFELAVAVAIAVRPFVGLLIFVAFWKFATETLFIVAGAPVWELVERAGSIAAPLALAALLSNRRYRTIRTQSADFGINTAPV